MSASIDVTRLFPDVKRDKWLTAERHVSDQTLAHFQTQLLQIVDVITAHGLGVKNARLVRPAFPLGYRPRTLDEIYAGGIIRDQRIKRVHDQVEDFVKIQRPADRLGDVEEHAQ